MTEVEADSRGRRPLLAAAVAAVMLVPAAVGGAAAQEERAPVVGYWTESEVIVADADGETIATFPDFDHFSLNQSLVAGERDARRSGGDRIVGYGAMSGDRLFRIRHATNPAVAATRDRVAFFPTHRRDEHVSSVWMRAPGGKLRRIAMFRPGPGLPGIRHGMRGGGGPLDVALDARGRYVAVAFGLEPLRSFDVWIVDSVTKEATRMTRGENSHNPSLSPGGDRLAVRVERPKPCADPLYGEILIGKIRVVSRATGEATDLTEFDCDLFYDTPRWVDDDTLLAVRVTKDATETLGYDLDVVRLDPATGGVEEVLTEGNPCCITASPLLRKIAYGFSDRSGFSVHDLESAGTLDFPGDVYVPHLAGEGRL